MLAVARDDGLERVARHVLHHDEEDVLLLLRRQNRDDVRMVERGQQARLAQQIAEVDVLPVRNLDGDFLVDPGVFGEVDSAESAAAEWRQDSCTFRLSDRGRTLGAVYRRVAESKESTESSVVVGVVRVLTAGASAAGGLGGLTDRARYIAARESQPPLLHRRATPAGRTRAVSHPNSLRRLISCVSQPPSGPINTMASSGRCPSRLVTS